MSAAEYVERGNGGDVTQKGNDPEKTEVTGSQEEEREFEVKITTFELFFDLVFVGIIHNVAEDMKGGPLGAGQVLTFILRICTTWWLWHHAAIGMNTLDRHGRLLCHARGARGMPGEASQLVFATAMMLVSFMAADTHDTNYNELSRASSNGRFLSWFLLAYTLVMSYIALQTLDYFNTPHKDGKASFMPFTGPEKSFMRLIIARTMLITWILLIPCSYLAIYGSKSEGSSEDRDMELGWAAGLWVAWVILMVGTQMITAWNLTLYDDKLYETLTHVETLLERLDLLTLILIGEVVGDSALAMPDHVGQYEVWLSVMAAVTAYFIWKLYFDMLPADFVHAPQIHTINNQALRFSHMLLAASIAGIGAAFSRALGVVSNTLENVGSMTESQQINSTVLLMCVAVSCFLCLTAIRMLLGKDHPDMTQPRRSYIFRALFKVAAAALLAVAALVWTFTSTVTHKVVVPIATSIAAVVLLICILVEYWALEPKHVSDEGIMREGNAAAHAEDAPPSMGNDEVFAVEKGEVVITLHDNVEEATPSSGPKEVRVENEKTIIV